MIEAVLLAGVALLATPEAVVITADGVALTAGELGLRARELRATGSRVTPEMIVDGMATEVALVAEARRSGLAKAPSTLARVSLDRARALAAAFTESLVPASSPVPDAEIARIFHDGEDTARLSVVVVETEAEARAVKARLQGGASFADEARRSLDPRSAASGGDTGTKPRAQVDPALAGLVFRARPGDLVGPVQLNGGGWAVARVVEVAVADEAGIPRARERIAAFARRQATAQARAHALEMYRRAATIKIDEAFLRSLGGRIEPTPGEAATVVATVGDQQIRYRDLLPALRGLAGVGHGKVTLKRQVVESVVDDLLLAEEGRKRGLEKDPAVRAALSLAELRAVAQEMALSLLASERASSPDRLNALLEKRSAAIRKKANVRIDRPAALEAAGGR